MDLISGGIGIKEDMGLLQTLKIALVIKRIELNGRTRGEALSYKSIKCHWVPLYAKGGVCKRNSTVWNGIILGSDYIIILRIHVFPNGPALCGYFKEPALISFIDQGIAIGEALGI